MHELFSSSVFFFFKTPPWNAGSPPEGKLAQVSVLVPDQLEDDADLGKGGRDWDGRSTFPWQLIESKGPKVVWERKKSKMQQRYLNITTDDLWRILDKLAGKKSIKQKS